MGQRAGNITATGIWEQPERQFSIDMPQADG
jgi:hypothetical protein